MGVEGAEVLATAEEDAVALELDDDEEELNRKLGPDGVWEDPVKGVALPKAGGSLKPDLRANRHWKGCE